jgi:Protein of unknwon function (DUF3310)
MRNALLDNVNAPPHYRRGGLEAIDVIEAFGLNFHLGNVVKYVLRHNDKDGLQDLKKAAWYLAREIANREGGS